LGNPAYPRYKNPTGSYVVDASRKLFIDKGYELTTLADIAEQLGVTKAAIYHWFKTKEQILLRIVTPFLDAVDDLLGKFGSRKGGALALGERVQLCRSFLELIAANTPDSALFLITSIRRQPVVEERVTKQSERLRELLGPEIEISRLPVPFDAAKPWLAPDVDIRDYVSMIPQVAAAVVRAPQHTGESGSATESTSKRPHVAVGPGRMLRPESAHR
jgi:AcrR family transcriptional regulator